MNINLYKELLDTLIDNSRRILLIGFGVNWAESSFFDIIKLLHQKHELKPYFLDRVRTTLSTKAPENLIPGSVPIELIELVAHETRWPEFIAIAEQRILNNFDGNKSISVGDIANRLPEAYKDDWPDREFYDHYKSHEN